MAQIIKFKRGSLENIETASVSLGELLLATGSSSVLGVENKSYDIGESLLFIASGSSTDNNPRAVNRFLAGGTAPDLSGNPVGKSLQGVPFYVTGSNKVVLLNDGADANSHITLDLTNNIDSGSLLPFISGSVFGTVSGDILINDAGVASIQANSVTLGTDTTGNYVGTITGGTGIASSGATTGEGIAHTLSVDLTELTLGNGLDAGGATTLNLDLTEVIATDGANRVLTSDGDGTLTGEANFTFNGSALTVTGTAEVTSDLTVGGDLRVNGDLTYLNVANLAVEDKFILLNSGSADPDEAGIVVDEGSGKGHGFVFDAGTTRWGFTGSLDSTATSVAPDAFAAAVVTTDIPEYQKNGNIRVTAGEIYIYVE